MRTIFVIFLVANRFDSSISSDVQRAFTKYEIFPDILNVAPNKIVQVNNVV